MIRSSLYTIISFSIAIVIVAAGFFLLGIEQTIIHFWALAFLILSLLMSMCLLLTITRRKTIVKDAVFYNAGASVIVWLYQVAVIISVALVGVFDNKVGRFIFVEITVLAVFIIIMLAINLFAQHTYLSNNTTAERKANGEYDAPKNGGF